MFPNIDFKETPTTSFDWTNASLEKILADISKQDYTPKKIIKSADRTIVFWKDGTKTIVKRSDDAVDDAYSAFCAALAQKIYGSNSQVKKILRTKVEVIPLSDRLVKKAHDEWHAHLAEEKAKEEAERPQKILNQYIDPDPIGTAMEEHKAELKDRIEKQVVDSTIRRRRRRLTE